MSEKLECCMYDEPAEWMLCKADHDAMSDLLEELLSWRKLVNTGRGIMALGAVIATIEDILQKEEFRCGVRVGWTHRPERMEGVSVDIAVNDDGISLDKIEFIPTGQGMSCDHFCETIAFLDKNGGFSIDQIARWLDLAAMVKGGVSNFETEIIWLSVE